MDEEMGVLGEPKPPDLNYIETEIMIEEALQYEASRVQENGGEMEAVEVQHPEVMLQRHDSEMEIVEGGVSTSLAEEGEWLLVGDFNEIAMPNEKKGKRRIDSRGCKRFSNWIDNCALIDLGYIGSRFIWRGPQWEGLDRVLLNAYWRSRFPEARIDILARTRSDHHPLLINLEP
ncbi:Endonuclease/exonuclease/phosphatase family protein [Arachis hypogaea]|nr:Endonuclease/exonuclease/phosphatase family protein [Arachis hypogaea]